MTRYPILFGFKDLIAGNGFFASVAGNGRALLVDEGDGFWMYGVNPGGISAGGGNVAEAQFEFRLAYKSVLFDLAAEAAGFDEFKAQVEQFYLETNEPTAEEWGHAVIEVRQGRIDADWLTKRKAESRIGVDIVLLEQAVPSVNALEDQADLAA